MILDRILCWLIGYAFGLIQTAFIYGKMKGIDIRQHGSGNAGTTNTLRVLGTKAGLIVFAGDSLKCIAAVWVVRLLFCANSPELYYLYSMYAAAGVIFGHNYPFFMKFKGGKGIASTAGLIISFHPYFVAVGMCMFFIPFLTTHYVSLGSLLLYLGFEVQMIIFGQNGILFGAMSQAQLNEMYIIGAILLAMAYFRHRTNIVKLIKHEERKTYLFKKNKVD